MSFATGFFNTATETLDRKQQYVRDHRAKTRDYLMTYGTQAVTGARSKVNDYVTIGMQLEGKGLEKDDLNFLVETSGPDALTNLYDLVKDYSPEELTPTTFRSMIQRTKDYSTESTYEQTIAKAFGLYKENVTKDPAKNEGIAYYASMLFNPKAADNETYIGGYTESDIRRIQGTVAPGLTAPLAVDFSKLPKRHSTTALGVYSQKSFVRMISTSQRALDQMMPTTTTDLSPEERTKYNKLKLAIEAKDYRVMLELVPETGAEILRMDKETGGGLSNNPFFKLEDGMEEFFVNTAARLSGDNSYLEDKWNNAKKTYPDLGALNSLNTYTTVAEAKESGERYFILGGAIRINETVPAKVVDGGQSSTGKITDISETGAADLNAASNDRVIVEEGPDSLKTQMLSLDVPDNVAGESPGELASETGDLPNPMLSGWQNLSLGALKDFNNAFKEFRKGAVNKSRKENEADYKAFNDDSDTMLNLLDSVGDFLEADAGGADEAKRTELADKMVVDLQAAPERVRLVVESLIDKLEAGEYDSEAVDDSFMGQVKTGFQTVSKFLGGTKYNEPESAPAVNDPQDVRDMGKMPFTNLNQVDPTDNATQFNSFDDVKAQLKTGELQQGDVIIYNTIYYTVDQSGAGPIGKVNTVKKSR
jgi:hypothetical protein